MSGDEKEKQEQKPDPYQTKSVEELAALVHKANAEAAEYRIKAKEAVEKAAALEAAKLKEEEEKLKEQGKYEKLYEEALGGHQKTIAELEGLKPIKQLYDAELETLTKELDEEKKDLINKVPYADRVKFAKTFFTQTQTPAADKNRKATIGIEAEIEILRDKMEASGNPEDLKAYQVKVEEYLRKKRNT